MAWLVWSKTMDFDLDHCGAVFPSDREDFLESVRFRVAPEKFELNLKHHRGRLGCEGIRF